MKKLLLGILTVISVSYMATAIVKADSLTSHHLTVQAQDDVKTEKEMEDLPDLVQTAFNESDYANLKIDKIYEVVKQEESDLIKKGETFYEFVLLNGPEKWAVQYTKEGKFIDAQKLDTEN